MKYNEIRQFKGAEKCNKLFYPTAIYVNWRQEGHYYAIFIIGFSTDCTRKISHSGSANDAANCSYF